MANEFVKSEGRRVNIPEGDGDLIEESIEFKANRKTGIISVYYGGMEIIQIKAKLVEPDVINSVLEDCVKDFFFGFHYKVVGP